MRRSATILVIQAHESTSELNYLHLRRFEIGYNKLEPILHRHAITVTVTVTVTRHIGSPSTETLAVKRCNVCDSNDTICTHTYTEHKHSDQKYFSRTIHCVSSLRGIYIPQ